MEGFLISFLSFKQYKKSDVAINICIFLNLIVAYNSISTEIKVISVPYLSLHNENSRIRNLSEQYIYGSAFKINYYYSNIYLGENMQKQGLILDTGSSITTSTCSPLCQSCGKHICPPYDIKSKNKIISCSDSKCGLVNANCDKSKKEIENKCSFSISYSEGSTLRGVYINELVRFGKNYKDQDGTYIPMGCTTYENHLFLNQEANGIMGLRNTENNFVEILFKLGAIKRNIFSLCFEQLGGIFTMGEINNKTHLEKMVFLPAKKAKDKYFGFNVKSILVNNRKLVNYEENKFNNSIYIDSGSTISYFSKNIFDEILNLTKEECQKFNKNEACGKYIYNSTFGHCFYFDNVNDLNYAVKNYWPTLHFVLDRYDYKWTPERYAFNITGENEVGACMGFEFNYGNILKFGSTWIIGHDILFDRENNLLGFAEADCTENKELNMTNGLELVTSHKENENIIGIKKNISLAVIIIAIFLIICMIVFILVIIFKNNKMTLEKQIELKIKENIKESKLNQKDVNYIKVSDQSLNGSKELISTNPL